MPKAKSERRILVIVASTHRVFEPDGLVLHPDKELPVTAEQADILRRIPEALVIEDREVDGPATTSRSRAKRPDPSLLPQEPVSAGDSSTPAPNEPTPASSGAPEE